MFLGQAIYVLGSLHLKDILHSIWAEPILPVHLLQAGWTADWHVSEECFVQALAGLIDAQHRQPLAAHWGSGTTSSSDAQFFRAGARGEVGGLVNLHYGQDPGVKFARIGAVVNLKVEDYYASGKRLIRRCMAQFG
jgi:hypothetical protein